MKEKTINRRLVRKLYNDESGRYELIYVTPRGTIVITDTDPYFIDEQFGHHYLKARLSILGDFVKQHIRV